jgi:hypothetical protein
MHIDRYGYPEWGPSQDPRLGDGEWAMIGERLRDRLNAILREGITTEAQLVNFITALRNLMEHTDYVEGATKFFCDWPLHSRIDLSTSEILIEMNHALEHSQTSAVIVETVGHKLSMDAFRDDLIHQLMHFALPTHPIGKGPSWRLFLQLYFRLIADSPVLSTKKAQKTMTKVDRLDVRLLNRPPQNLPRGADYAFTIHWEFRKNRDIILQWDNDVLYPTNYKPNTYYQLHQAR